jgi:hypothetical protein
LKAGGEGLIFLEEERDVFVTSTLPADEESHRSRSVLHALRLMKLPMRGVEADGRVDDAKDGSKEDAWLRTERIMAARLR